MLDPKSPVQMSKPVTLQDISYRDFHAIVSKITSNPNWRLIPDLIELSAEQQGSRFSYEVFTAKHTQYQSDEERGRAILKEYRSWGVSIEALVHVLKNSTVSMDEAAEFVQSKNIKPKVTSAYPETMSQIFNPPPVSCYRTTNKMVIVPDDDELNRRCEEFLKGMAYELLFDHGTHQFWELPFGHVPAILVKARLSKSDAICSALVAHRVVTDVSFLLKADCYGQLTQESALERMRMDDFWSVVVRTYLDTKKFDVQFFGVSDQDMIKDVDLMCWLVKPITESPAVCINFGLKDDGMPIDTATIKTAAALERCDLCHTKQARSLSSSTNVYFYGPAMLAWTVTLKLKVIIEELQKEGLKLVTVNEVFVDDLADLMFQPQNAITLRDDQMDILCQMESDGVPKILRGERWQLWAE